MNRRHALSIVAGGMLIVSAVAGCSRVKGNHTRPGATPDQIQDGEVAFSPANGTTGDWQPAPVISHTDAAVTFKDRFGHEWTTPMALVIPHASIQVGDVLKANGDELGVYIRHTKDQDLCDYEKFVVTVVDDKSVGGNCGDRDRRWPYRNVEIPAP